MGINLSAWGGLVYAGLIGTLAIYLCYQFTIKYASPLFASMLSYTGPVVTFIWAYFLLKENLTPAMIVGGVIALMGVWFTTSTK